MSNDGSYSIMTLNENEGAYMKTINLPEAVHEIIRALNRAGFEAYIVGGCVRDSLLGREPKDWDITTSARPEDVKALFPYTFDTGIKHGTITVRRSGESYEVTTYRVDGNYSDHRRPDQVAFSSSLKEDLLRRDFTINAMAYHPETGLVDLYQGLRDLEQGVVRCVGNAADRFQEDALRMLRAVRFSAQLGFSIDPVTYRAIGLLKDLIRHVSWERIRDEMTKILISEHPEVIRQVHETGLMRHIIPEWDAMAGTTQNHPYHLYTVAEHTVRAVCSIEADPVLRWTMLLHDIGKPSAHSVDTRGIDHFVGHVEEGVVLAGRVLNRLKFDNNSKFRILSLIRYHESHPVLSHRFIRRITASIGQDLYLDLLKVQEADAKAKNPEYGTAELEIIRQSRAMFEEMMRNGDPVSLRQLAVSGQDLIDLGFERGPVIGRVLQLLLEQTLEDPSLNRREFLLEVAQKLLESGRFLQN